MSVSLEERVVLGRSLNKARLMVQAAGRLDLPTPLGANVSDDGSVSFLVRSPEDVNRWANWIGGVVRVVPLEGRVHHIVDRADMFGLTVEVFAVVRDEHHDEDEGA